MSSSSRLALLACLSLLGCDTEKAADVTAALARPPATFKASCTTASLGVCTEYTDDGCLETRGAWSPARCPREGRLGTCATRGSRRVYYPGGDLDFTSTTAARDCVELYQGAFSAR
jgi:hypothetical protein